MDFVYFSSPRCKHCDTQKLLGVEFPECDINSPFDDDWAFADSLGVEGIPCLLHKPTGKKLSGVVSQATLDKFISEL